MGFYALEGFYCGYDVIINENNMIDILFICVCYNEENLLKKCVDYILSKKNDVTFNKILMKRKILSNQNLNEIKNIIDNYIKRNEYKLIKMIVFIILDLINTLTINEIQDIIQNNEVFIDDESAIINNLLIYYNYHNKEDIKESINEILKKFDYSKINLDQMTEEKLYEFPEIKGIIENQKYIVFSSFKLNINKKIEDIIHLYYFKDNLSITESILFIFSK